ncbi:MAG: hypothetical protein H8D23_19870 [Candidatus Brocadiales bacterium]|nr:hypothetical protein [Candidatus Brocadiales bacterium]
MKKLPKVLFWLSLYSYSIPLIAQEAPWWVSTKPVSDSQKYVGIGWASISDPNYSLKAEQNALRSIAIEINTLISGQTRRRVISINDISEREFTNEFIVSTLGNFKGLQKKDDFIDIKNQRYYIYFEYSKSDHRKNIEDTKKQAINLVTEYEAIRKKSFVLRLQKLVYSYESLFQLYGEDVFSNVNGRNVNLQSFVPSEIQRLIRLVNLTDTTPIPYQTVYMEPLVTQLIFDVALKLPRTDDIPIDNLPFDFQFEAGAGDFAYQDVTSAEGLVINEVSKITSKIPIQYAVSFIDLKALKRGTSEFYHLDKALDKLSSINKINFKIKVSLVSQDHIFFGVSFSEGIPNPLMDPIREAFEVAFNKRTQFKIVDRVIVKAILSELGMNEEDLCTKSECDVEVGKRLGVNRMIKININYKSSDDEIEVIFTDTDVKTRLVQRKEPYSKSVINGNVEAAIFNNLGLWVVDFYEKLNPPMVNLKSNVPGLKVSYRRIKSKSDLPGVTYSQKDEYQFLPLIDFEMDPGTYLFTFEKDGYESKKREITLNANSICCDDVELKEKSRFKAFYRSFFFPGLGQNYGKDSRNQNRSGKALLHASIGLIATAGTIYAWNIFTKKQNTYNASQLAYSRSTTVSGIESTRQEAIIANKNLNQSYNTAIVLSVIMAGFSTYSGIDASVTLPKY